MILAAVITSDFVCERPTNSENGRSECTLSDDYVTVHWIEMNVVLTNYAL